MPDWYDPSHVYPTTSGRRRLEKAAAQADDVLLFCYVGHGLLSAANELHLATRATVDPNQGGAAVPGAAVPG